MSSRLFGAEDLIPGIPQTGQNIADVVESFINGGNINLHIGMGLGYPL